MTDEQMLVELQRGFKRSGIHAKPGAHQTPYDGGEFYPSTLQMNYIVISPSPFFNMINKFFKNNLFV